MITFPASPERLLYRLALPRCAVMQSPETAVGLRGGAARTFSRPDAKSISRLYARAKLRDPDASCSWTVSSTQGHGMSRTRLHMLAGPLALALIQMACSGGKSDPQAEAPPPLKVERVEDRSIFQ